MNLRSLIRHETFLALLLVVVLIVLSFQSDRFFTVSNLLNQGRLMTEIGLIAIAMTFVIATGGIDLSVGSILGLTAILTGVFWQNVGMPLPAAAAAAIAVGTLAGFVNGAIITRFGVPPLIATLATLALYRGLAEGISQARSVRGYPDWFYVLGQGEVLSVPTQLWILAAAAVVASIILAYTRWGRTVYAIGSNEVASRFSGLSVERTKLALYTASGFAAAVAGVIFVSRVSTTRSDMGTGIELDAITAVVLGGTSIFGGRGSYAGTIVGALILRVLDTLLTLMRMPEGMRVLLFGLIILIVTAIYVRLTDR